MGNEAFSTPTARTIEGSAGQKLNAFSEVCGGLKIKLLRVPQLKVEQY